MTPNPSLYQGLQLGAQAQFGTAVSATRRLASIVGGVTPVTETADYRPAGSRLTSVVALNKEHALVNIDTSPLTYNELVYLLDSLLGTASPTGNGTTTPYVRAYTVSRGPSAARAVYTVEYGSAARGFEVPDAMVSSLSFNFSRDGATMTGEMIGNAVVDNQALTGSLPELDIIPVTAPQVGLRFAGTQAGLAGASLTTEDFVVTLDCTNLSAPVWALNQQVGFSSHVDTLPTFSGTVSRNVDTAGMALLSNLRAGSTHFMRISATGPALAGITPAANNALQIDVAMKISGVTFEDHEGVQVANWSFNVGFDPTWGNGMLMTVTNGLATV